MKQVAFLIIFSTILLSCSSSKQSLNNTIPDYFKDTAAYYSNPYVAKYRNSPGFIPPDVARAYINEFRRHTFQWPRRKKLKIAWTKLDQTSLKNIICDPDTDSVAFYLAAFPISANIPPEYKKIPFVIMQTKNKTTVGKKSNPIFIGPNPQESDICPPPKTGCKVQFQY